MPDDRPRPSRLRALQPSSGSQRLAEPSPQAAWAPRCAGPHAWPQASSSSASRTRSRRRPCSSRGSLAGCRRRAGRSPRRHICAWMTASTHASMQASICTNARSSGRSGGRFGGEVVWRSVGRSGGRARDFRRYFCFCFKWVGGLRDWHGDVRLVSPCREDRN